MKLDLRSRVALVTGSTNGLGKSIIESLAAEGATVIIHGRDAEKANRLCNDLMFNYGVSAYVYIADANDPQKDFSEFLRPIIGRLDILVNNVGNIQTFGNFEDLKEEDWQKSFNLTFMSAVRFTKQSLPYLKKSNQARIINISSLSGKQPSFTGLNPHYATAKAALNTLTKCMANEFGKYKINVNAICSSTLAGGGWDANIIDRAKRDGKTTQETESIMRKEESNKNPLGIMGELKDVANMVTFLASSKARILTGHCYNVDGGVTRTV